MTILHSSFELIDKRSIEALDITVLTSRHLATGAIHYHLACDHSENALMIGFATQPMTSRGEAHILEHVVLCGSEKYPVRDPFFSMIKRSLNTFMNAMTASDWTVYPFASQNKKDFFNLLSVYLDAVFFPNIHPLDFAQEGIRVEINQDNQPEYHGIVFNEMKGAMSGEIDQLYYALAPHLFPTTTYHYNSGGDPAKIPDLTHEDLVAFHQAHYHPSNATIMSFGDIAVDDIQARIHDEALSRFDDIQRPAKGRKFSSVLEKSLDAPIQVNDTYSSDSADQQMTHHVLAWLLPTITDPRLRLSLRLVEGVLSEHSGSPLRAYLESHPLATAPSPLLGLDDSHYQMTFYAGVRGSEPEHAEELEQGILALLNQIADNPISQEVIETILHQIEIDQRHIGGDSMPYGLTLMLEAFSTAIHGGDPLDVWQIDEHLAWLKQKAQEPNWVQNLIREYLIDNPHRIRLTLSPDTQKAARLIADEHAALAALDATLSDDDKQVLIKQALALKARQAVPDDISVLPKVGLEDVPSQVAFTQGIKTTLTADDQEYPVHLYHAGTNGLYYYQVITPLTDEMIDQVMNNPLLPLYLTLLSEVGTKKYDARTFQAVQASHSSGVTARISQRTDLADPQRLSSYFVVATRALNRKLEAIELVSEVVNDSIFSETDRIREILQQKQSSWQARLAGAGHAYAMQTASRQMSRQARTEYAYSGLPALAALKSFLASAQSDEALWDSLCHRLSELHQALIGLPKQVLLVCEEQASQELLNEISKHINAPKADTSDEWSHEPLVFDTLNGVREDDAPKTAWLISTNVYHNAAAYQATTSGHADTPALMVLAPFLRHGYLHSAIREKGGAYGGGASFDSNAAAFRFYSYRDPHCAETFAHFDKSIDWLLENEHETEQLHEAILGIVSGMDKPGSPAGEAVKSCFSELHHRDQAWQQQLRANILSVTIDDLKRVARKYLKDQPCYKASLAPMESESVLTQMGFEIKKLG
ncbi:MULTISPECIES: insulinase family protein [Moraxella]|uniref:Metalloprotease, insulinase family n=1 Tax=Moraxella catarrhalis TaxID=480 RepID=A0A7Z1A3Q6_MORCA|nr:insulinase family protein [Moraxella catarrhalis]OAV00390.1 metalloprotease, insulinase family [Moraxella catarrhalis]STY82637.1 protease3 [Moraxella catarrhalis]